jgi:hypothetical protein
MISTGSTGEHHYILGFKTGDNLVVWEQGSDFVIKVAGFKTSWGMLSQRVLFCCCNKLHIFSNKYLTIHCSLEGLTL